MTLMTVNNHDEQGKDYRSQPRWSATLPAWPSEMLRRLQYLLRGTEVLALKVVVRATTSVKSTRSNLSGAAGSTCTLAPGATSYRGGSRSVAEPRTRGRRRERSSADRRH